jgi:hypothetical protein
LFDVCEHLKQSFQSSLGLVLVFGPPRESSPRRANFMSGILRSALDVDKVVDVELRSSLAAGGPRATVGSVRRTMASVERGAAAGRFRTPWRAALADLPKLY